MLKKSPLTLAVVSALLCGSLQAEGYKLYEQSVSSMGTAYAGRGAQVTDASLVYSNPAALTRLQGAHFAGGVSFVAASSRYSDAQAFSANGQPVAGRSDGNNKLRSVIPFVFYSNHLNERLSYGLGLYVPFGIGAEYDDDFVGRYFATETGVQVVSAQISLGYQLTTNWSVGAGVSLNRVSGVLSKYKDHSGLCELGEAATNALFGAPVYNDAYCHSHYEVKGDDLAPGFSLGLHGEPWQGTRLALMYQSAIRFTLTGDSVISNTPITGANVQGHPGYLVIAPQLPAIDVSTGKLAAMPQLTEASQLDLTTPASVAFSLDQQLTELLSLQFSLAWTEWSRFQSIDIISADQSPSLSLSTELPQNLNAAGYIGYIPQKWQNSWSAAVGFSFQAQPNLLLKTGLAFDQNPIRPERKTARIPTDDRTWLTLGANWRFSAKSSLDFAIGHMWMPGVSVDEFEYNVQDQSLYQSRFQANYRNKALLMGMQFNRSF